MHGSCNPGLYVFYCACGAASALRAAHRCSDRIYSADSRIWGLYRLGGRSFSHADHFPYGCAGLPSIWVLVAVTLGGSMMGVVGMLIFIPLCSVLYTLLRDTVNERLKRRKLSVKPDDLKRDSAEN